MGYSRLFANFVFILVREYIFLQDSFFICYKGALPKQKEQADLCDNLDKTNANQCTILFSYTMFFFLVE